MKESREALVANGIEEGILEVLKLKSIPTELRARIENYIYEYGRETKRIARESLADGFRSMLMSQLGA